MNPDILLTIIDSAGLYVFAISGAIVAVRKEMDAFGVLVLAFLPAIGGGTLRDLLLDAPVFWLTKTESFWFILAGAATAFVGHKWLEKFKPLRWADAVGMAFFAVSGAAKAMTLNHNMTVVIVMGMITACAGGLIRDVVVNEEPLLLKTDIYATAALLGSAVYYVLIIIGAGQPYAMFGGFAAALTLRGLAMRYKWSMPKSPF